ncbi:MAG: beta-propeller domain-containing protein [Oscillospiraceae bacterium]|nr:beta-propeller domain-containing protein [Oscillospiraceae bacterium]
MKKDIEKYINDNIKAETPPSLSKENIGKMLDASPDEEKRTKRKKLQTVYKFAAVAAAFAIVLSAVSMYSSVKNPKNIPLDEGGLLSMSADDSYDEIYARLKEIKNNWVFASGANFDTAEIILDQNGTELVGDAKNPESAPQESNKDEAASVAATDKNFGTTNTQEENIDEGDIIKTDGKNIYLADKNNKAVYIVKADNGKMNKLSEIKIAGDVYIQELYLAENKLVVVYAEYDYSKQSEQEVVFNGTDTAVSFRCGCPASWIYSETKINIYDISNPENVSLISSLSQSGDFVSSRLNKGKLYLVSSYCVDISSDDYKKKCIPEVKVNGKCERIPASKIMLIKDADTPTYAVISTIDVASSERTDSVAILGNPTNVYATENSFYLVEPKYNDKKHDSYLNICKFEFTETGVQYKASAQADGRLNSNLSMSEFGGYFRIATTCQVTKFNGNYASYEGETNKLYIFDSEMKQAGLIDGFAKDEQIRSERYIGEYAYIVTFRQTDPLFVINLSDPKNPKIESALKLPGFSSYLHPIENGMLIGIGYDGDEFSANGNMKVSLFSVADPKNPKELSSVKVGNNGDYISSDVFYSYKAFTSLPNGEFAVPVSIDFSRNQMYIRYKVSGGTVSEIARYSLGSSETEIIGGTYIGNHFYAFSSEFVDGVKSEDVTWKARLTSFNMETNKHAETITLL